MLHQTFLRICCLLCTAVYVLLHIAAYCCILCYNCLHIAAHCYFVVYVLLMMCIMLQVCACVSEFDVCARSQCCARSVLLFERTLTAVL